MIIGKHDLPDLRATTDNATIALRLGSYDLLHSGHQNGLNFAASQADILVVGVMPDEYLRRVKGAGRPINDETTRVTAINEAENVNYALVVPGDILGLARVVRELRPDVYVEGHEHRNQSLKSIFLGYLGVKYALDSQTYAISTTLMINRLGLKQATECSSLNFTFGMEGVS